MVIVCQYVGTCIDLLLYKIGRVHLLPQEIQIMNVIIAMDLGIEVMNVGIGKFIHMTIGTVAMINMEMGIEHMRDKGLHGTKGEIPLQDQEVHGFQ